MVRVVAVGVLVMFVGFAARDADPRRGQAVAHALSAGRVVDAGMTVAGRRRSFHLYVPAGATPAAGWPLVVALHGGGREQSGERMALATGLDRQADRRRFVIVYPDALGGRFNAGVCCQRGVPDVRFIDAVVRRVRRMLPIDRRQITATGFSNGGFMAYRLACLRARTFTTVAVIAAVQPSSHCRPARAVSVLHIHGAKDPRLGLRGRFGSPTIRGHAETWRRINGCRTRRTSADEQREQIAWSGCRRNTRVRLLILRHYGHGWPGALPPYGNPGDSFSASVYVADFLLQNAR